MSKHNTITKLLFTCLAATLLTACGGGGSSASYTNNENTLNTASGDTIQLGVDNPVCKQGTANQEGKVIDSATNKGIENVTVTVAGCSVQTDSNGYYTLNNIVTSNRTSVTFDKKGYLKNSSIINIDNSTSNYLEFKLETSKWKWSYNTKVGTNGGTINIADDAIYTIDDNSYSGDVTAYYTWENTNTPKGRDLFPGTFEGLETNGLVVPFTSYAFFNLVIKDTQGNNINTSGDIIVKVQNIKNLQDEIIPLWYYNYDQGIWIEKGSAKRDPNGDYICEIPHVGTWSLNKPVETEMGRYKGNIVDENDQAITNVRIEARGKNWISKDVTTDENGEFEVQVVPNQKFSLSAYNYKEKYGAQFPEQLSAISAGDVVEE